MASLRLTFPEKDQPTVIALTGARVTIGRLPFNTIQIIDRTVSGFHAELVSEHGHYRLHDRGSSNGTFVNGQKIADYHLNEACTITFGTVEAQFSPEVVPAGEEAETFPTRAEINVVRQENADLKATVAALREEAHALRLARPVGEGDAALAVPKEEFDKVVVEREALKEARLKLDEELSRLKIDLAVLKRDRVNLQLAYDGVQREGAELRAKAGLDDEDAIAPKAAAVALAAQAPPPGEEVRIEVPAPPAEPPAAEAPAPPEESEAPAPALPKQPAAPPASLPKAPNLPGGLPKAPGFQPKSPGAPAGPAKPFAPLPKAPAVAATGGANPASPAVPAKAPVGLGGGVRPLAAKPLAPAGAKPAAVPGQVSAPTTRLGQTPTPASKLAEQPTVKMTAIPPKVGPKGTQKIE